MGQQAPGKKSRFDFIEQVLLNVLVPVHQHLALFTLGKGMLCYALFGKRVVIVGDAQVAHII